MFENMSLGFCSWDLPAFIVLVVVIGILYIQQRNFKNKKKELEQAIQKQS